MTTANRGRRRPRIAGAGAAGGRQPDHYNGLLSDTDEGDLEEQLEEAIQEETRSANERVQRLLTQAQQRQTQQRETGMVIPDEDDQMAPEDRLATVRRRAPQYEREYRLRLVHRLLMRNIPLDEIGQQLGVSVSTIERDRREIYRRVRDEASKLDINALLGSTMAYYQETGAMAMRIATSDKTPTATRLAALRTSMQSRKEMGQWLSVAGVFEVLKFTAEQEGASADLGRLLDLTERILSEDDMSSLGNLTDEEKAEEDNINLLL